jgi:predicted secreted protein with PEFG-CTERM motif
MLASVVLILILSISITTVYAQTTQQFEVKDPSGTQSYQVNYGISGATVQNISINQNDASLIVDMTSTDGGTLTMSMPRALIDAKSGSSDDQFIVLVDGADSDFNETQTTTSDRTITVDFPAGTEQIEIIGTQVVPEFGGLSFAILAIAVISIVVFSTKSRLKFRI